MTQEQIEFIQKNIDNNIAELALLYAGKRNDLSFLLIQIEARQKAKKKLPLWFDNQECIFPKTLSIEQSSSIDTAKFKQSLFKNCIRGGDLTAGFGVDSFYLSKQCKQFDYNEINADLVQIVIENFKLFKIENINFYNYSAEHFLENIEEKKYDFLYIDPSRRSINGKRINILSQGIPNVIALIPKILKFTNSLLIKTSPMMDISLALKELEFVRDVYCISVKNEIKEILYMLDFNKTNQNEINYYDIEINNDKVIKTILFPDKFVSKFYDIQKYMYEPAPSLMKYSFWGYIEKEYKISKIAANTHFFTSNELMKNFRGSVFKVISEMNLKKIRKNLPDMKAHIITRNYPLSADELRKKLKLIPSGNKYILAFKDREDKKRIFLVEKILY